MHQQYDLVATASGLCSIFLCLPRSITDSPPTALTHQMSHSVVEVKIGKYDPTMLETDPESVQTAEHAPGFAELAGYLASDCERSVYKRFRWLTARNLLMMQAEITSLEERIRNWDMEDRLILETHDEATCKQLRATLTSFDALVESAKSNKRDGDKLEVFMKLRTLLPEYRGLALQT